MMKLSAIFSLLCTVLLAGCSWVNDNYDHCPSGTWVQLSYTYNMLNAEAVGTQVSNASIVVLDSNGQCVGEENADSASLQQNQFKIQLPDLPDGTYDILVWAGLDDPHYRHSTTGVELNLTEETAHEALGSLFFGRIGQVQIDGEYRVVTVPLTKDTQLIGTTLQLLSPAGTLNAEDFRLEISANNRQLDTYNRPSGAVCYTPFLHQSAQLDDLHVVQSGSSILRLTVGDNTRMRLIHVPTGSQVFDIPLTDYLILAGMTDYLNMEEQEYLDREDRYDLMFFLNETQLPETPYVCTMLQIRSWIIRLNETELG